MNQKGGRDDMWREQNKLLRNTVAIYLIVVICATLLPYSCRAQNAFADSSYKFTRTFIRGGGDITSKFHITINGKKAIGLCRHGGPNSAASGRASVRKVSRTSSIFYLAYYYGYHKNDITGAQGCDLARAFHYAYYKTAYHQGASKSKDMIETAKDWCKKNGVPENFEVYYCNPSDGSQEFVAWAYYSDGKLKLIKESSNQKIAGAPGYTFKGIQYKVYEKKSTSSTCYGTLSMTAGGTSNVIDIPPDGDDNRTCYLMEVKNNSFYKKDSAWKPVTIKSGKTIVETVKDEPVLGELSFQKDFTAGVDSNTNKKGFKFTLTNRKNTSFTYSAVSDAEGKVQFKNIPIGTYLLRENLSKNQLAKGWRSKSGELKVTIRAGGNSIPTNGGIYLNEKDRETSGIIISKKTNDGGAVNGWSFTIRNKTTGKTYTRVTDAAGMIKLEHISAGNYIVTENMNKEQNLRYQNPEPQTGVLAEDTKEYLVFSFENKAIEEPISLRKVSEDGNVEGIEFLLTGTKYVGTQQESPLPEPIIAVTDVNGKIDFGKLVPGEYVVEETGYSDEYRHLYKLQGYENPARKFIVTQNKVVMDGKELKDGMIEFENVPYQIQLQKTCVLVDGTETNDPVEGAGYDLYKVENNEEVYVGAYETDEKGVFTVYGIQCGKYRLYETVVPTGYVEKYKTAVDENGEKIQKFDGIDITVDDSQNGKILVKDTNQQKYGSIFVVKEDDFNAPVEDAEFGLYVDSQCQTPAKDVHGKALIGKTDAKGYLMFENLPWKTYYLKEISAPCGYNVVKSTTKVVIGKNQDDGTIITDQEIHIKNDRKTGSVELVKVDEQKNKIEAPATYDLCQSDGTIIRSGLITGEDNNDDGKPDGDGVIRVEQLPWGSYYFIEKKAPEGYGISDEKITVTVNAMSCGTLQKKFAKDVMLTSQVIATKKVLANDLWFAHGDPSFIFKLKGKAVSGESKEYYKTVTFGESYVEKHTDSDGYTSLSAVFTNIPVGDYILSEEEVSRYDLEKIEEESLVNGTIEGKTVEVKLSEENAYAAATFINKKYEWNNYSDSHILNNSIKKTRTYMGVSAEYRGESLEANKPISNFSEFLEVWAVYDDGSSKELKQEEYRVTDIDGNVFEKTPKVAGTYTLFIEHEEDGITNMATVEIQVKAPEKLTVKFNTNGGNSLADLSVYKYDTLAESTNDVTRYTTVRVDYDFLGWYMDSDLTQSFDVENTRVTENITLYAKWKNQYSNYAMLLSDGTLTFAYIKEDAVKRGTYNGKTIQDYYTGFDTADYTMETQVPWYTERLRVKNVEVEDSFTPKSMSYWFCDMQNCSAINIANINTKQDTKVKGIFRNMAALEQITVGSQWEWQQGNELPKPSRAKFDYADGKWYSDASGRGYDPEEMPAGTADTYYAFPIQRVLTGIEERAMDLYSLIDSNKSKLEQKSSAGFLKQSNFIHGYQSYTATSVKSKSSEGLLSKTFDAKNCQKPLGIVGYYCTGTNSTYLSPYRKFVNVSNKSMYYTVRNIHTKDATNIVPYVDVLYLGK